MCLSRVPLTLKAKKVYVYRLIKKIKPEEIDDIKWKDVKSLIERGARIDKCSEEELKLLGDAVCTGQELISRDKLTFLIGKIYGGKEDSSHVTIESEETRDLEIPKDLAIINYIIGQGFEKSYVRKGATEYVYHEGVPMDQNNEKFVTISPSVVVHERNAMFLEVNVRWSLAPSGNNWWRQFCNWKSKKPDEQDRLAKLIKSKHARTRHAIKKGRGFQGVTLLGVTDRAVGDRMNDKSEETTTFQEYFSQSYNMNLDPKGPVLKCRFANTRKLVLYPAEILQPLFVFDIQSINVQLCSMYPEERFRHVKDVLEKAKAGAIGKYLEGYGLSFTTNLVSLRVPTNGGVLRCPKVYFPGGKTLDAGKYPEQLGFIKELMNLSTVNHHANGNDFPQLMCTSDNSQEIVKNLQQIGVPVKTGKGDVRRVAQDSFYVVSMRSSQTNEYKDAKMACGSKGVASQCYWRRLEAVIPKMIALQIAAKLGLFNFFVNVGEVAPSFAKSDLLIIGVDVGPPARTRPARLLTCVAFYVRGGKTWETRCDHTWVDTRNKANQDISVARINEALKKFLEATAKFYGVSSRPGTLLLCRSPASSGELPMCFNWSEMCKSVFAKWSICVVGSQSRGDTKLAWDMNNNGKTEGFRNVPRGLCVEDNLTIPVTVDGVSTVQSFRGFRLCGANCVLGQANTLLYLVFERDQKLSLSDLQNLLYALCFMYPNMPGALPMPLPIKAAMEYNKKFNPLPDLKKLHEKMRGTMHYL